MTKKILKGRVTSAKSNKTIVVEVTRKFKHPFYSKVIENMMKDLGLYKNTTYGFNLWVQLYNSETTTHLPHSHYGIGGAEIISFTHVIDASKNKCFIFLLTKK